MIASAAKERDAALPQTPLPEELVRPLRLLLGLWLLGWYLNATWFLETIASLLREPLDFSGLAAVFEQPFAALVAYLVPSATCLLLLNRSYSRRSWTLAFGTASLCSFVCLLQVALCNDATFLTSLWVGLWGMWISHTSTRPMRWLVAVAQGLAHAVVGLLFLGGTVFKLTPEYWSGSAFHELYFLQEHGWPFIQLRELGADTVRTLATYFSRAAILLESVLSAALLLPLRWVLLLYVPAVVVMVISRGLQLLSVHACVLGMLLAVAMLRHRSPTRS